VQREREVGEVAHELVQPRVPAPRELRPLRREGGGRHLRLADGARARAEEREVLAEVEELEDDVERPDASGVPAEARGVERRARGGRGGGRSRLWGAGAAGERERERVEEGAEGRDVHGGGQDGVGEKVAGVVERVEGEHGPALEALKGKERARRRRAALERDEPLEDGQDACRRSKYG
jgi:hypothetical protein